VNGRRGDACPVREELEALHADETGIRLEAGVWLVSAHR